MRHLKVDEKNEGSSHRFLSGHMFLNHCLMVGNRGETYMTFPAGRGLPQKCSETFSYATVLSVIAGSVTYFINMPAVVQPHYFLHSSYWHMDSMHARNGS